METDEQLAARLQIQEMQMEKTRLEVALRGNVGTTQMKETYRKQLAQVITEMAQLKAKVDKRKYDQFIDFTNDDTLKYRKLVSGNIWNAGKTDTASNSSSSSSSKEAGRIAVDLKGPLQPKTIRYNIYQFQKFEAVMEHYAKECGLRVSDLEFRYSGNRVYTHHVPNDFRMNLGNSTPFTISVDKTATTRENDSKNNMFEQLRNSLHRKENDIPPNSSSSELLTTKFGEKPNLASTSSAYTNSVSSSERIKLKIIRPQSLIPAKPAKFSVVKNASMKMMVEKYCDMNGIVLWSIIIEHQGKTLNYEKSPAELNLFDGSVLNAFCGDEYSKHLSIIRNLNITDTNNLRIIAPKPPSFDSFIPSKANLTKLASFENYSSTDLHRIFSADRSNEPQFAGLQSRDETKHPSFNGLIDENNLISQYQSGNRDEDSWTEQQVQEKIEKLLEFFGADIPKEDRMNTPPEMAVQLKEYQKIGLTWMTRMEQDSGHRGGILCDEMGLGKTVQAIATILANPPKLIENDDPKMGDFIRIKKKRRMGTLIVLPVSLMDQWKTELESLILPDHHLRVLSYHNDYLSSSDKRKFETNPSHLQNFDIVLTTYTTLSNQFPFDKSIKRHYTTGSYIFDREDVNVGPLFKIKWFRCILDEAHTIKNRMAQSSIACSYIDAERKWCLTGTPIQNTSDDIFSLFRYLKLEPYCSWSRFATDLSINPGKHYAQKSFGMTREKKLQKLQAVLQCCLLRRTKATKIDGSLEPIVTLPPKIVNHDQAVFSSEERSIYKDLEDRNISKFNRMIDNLERNMRNILVMIMRMRQLCLHHYLITNGKNLIADMMSDEEAIQELVTQLKDDPLKRLKASISEEVLPDCAICLELPTEPVTTMCGHIYCGECIINHVENKTTRNGAADCPNCRSIISRNKLVPLLAVEKHLGFSKEELDAEEVIAVKKEDSTSSELYISTKMKRVLQVLEETRKENPGEKTIIFCSFTKMLDLLHVPLQDNGFGFTRLDGTMKIPERIEAVSKFAKNSNTTVMLASLRCASVGLNLCAANRVILLDVWWNPALENQAIDRVHRIGQLAEKVIVTKITIPDTIEDRILKLQESKQEMTNALLSEGGTGGEVKRLSRAELIYLFRGDRR